MLTRDEILGLDDLPKKEIYVPEWKGSVYVRALSLAEVYALEQKGDVPAVEYVVIATVDKDGKPLFTKDDVEALSAKNASAMARIARAVFDLNTIGDSQIEAAKKG